jgi:hypothetical protein
MDLEICLVSILLITATDAKVHPVIGVGTLPLPNITDDKLPQHCKDFQRACDAERAGDLDTAFAIYESRYEECGDYGWTSSGREHGQHFFALFKTTPCGLSLVVKVDRGGNECGYLKKLTTGDAYNKLSRLGGFGKANLSESNFHHVKSLFVQSLRILDTLRSADVEHRDFMWLRNILIHTVMKEDGKKHYRVTFIDFGSAKQHHLFTTGVLTGIPKQFPSPKPRTRGVGTSGARQLGNGRHSDPYALACSFAQLIDFETDCFVRLDDIEVYPDVYSFRHVLSRLMHESYQFKLQPDYEEFIELTHMRKRRERERGEKRAKQIERDCDQMVCYSCVGIRRLQPSSFVLLK